MKTKLITLFIAIFAIIGSASAQQYDRKMDLYKNGTVVKSYDITDVDSLKFRHIANSEVAEYRIKDLGTGYYLNAGNYDTHTAGPVGGVNLVAYAESADQIFTFTQSGSNYILTTKSGYNIVCQPWNVDALTSAGTALTFVDNGNGTYYIMNGSDYFKVEEVDGVYYPFCGAPSSMKATWILEQVGGAVTYTISVSSGEGGTAVASKSSVQEGGSVTLTATPNSGYVFKNWTLNGNVVSTQNPYTATITAETAFVANFVEKQYCVVDGNMANTGNGAGRKLNSFTLSDGTTQLEVTSIQTSATDAVYKDKTDLVLTTNPGATLSFSAMDWTGAWMHAYVFVDYNKDKEFNQETNNNGTTTGEIVSYNAYNVSTTSTEDWRDITGASVSANCGVSASNIPSWTLPANLAAGDYRLRFKVDWNSIDACGDADIKSNNGCIVDVTLRIELPLAPTYAVSVSADATMGTAVASKSSVQEGGSVTLTATPNIGYKFKNWTLNGNVVSTQNPYTATVTANSVYVANFEVAEYRIKDLGTGYYLNAGNYDTHTAGPVGGVNLVAYAESADQIFTFTQSGSNYILTTKSGYNIVCQPWNVDALTSAGTALTFVDNGNGTYYIMNGSNYFKVEEVDGVYYPYCDAPSSMKATWILEKVGGAENYTISVSAGIVPSNGGTVTINGETGTQYVSDGGTATFVATPNSGYVFRNWTLNGNVVSTQNPYTATITANSEYVANFEEAINNGHAYVDLGLPSGTRWATCNVGATSPEEYGDYFAWGETTPKASYDWGTYKYCNDTKESMTKYCEYSYYGKVDNKTTLELSDDAARANWGGTWRMPTEAEYEELIDTNNCTWECIARNGVRGYEVTSKKNGNSIFLPAAGYRVGSYLNFAGSYGYYWSSSLDPRYSFCAYGLLDPDADANVYFSDEHRCQGRSVRAVCGDAIYTVSVSSGEGGTAWASNSSILEGGSVNLIATPEKDYHFVNWTVDGVEVSTKTFYTAIITEDVEYKANFKKGIENGHVYVDLGLSVKWATCNVGATSPEEYGDYFAWGETTPKTTYDWSTYKYCNGTSDSMTKYCTSLNYAYDAVDNKKNLGLSDDAARVNWGGRWRMPTLAEYDELIDTNNCTWVRTTQNGVDGYIVISKKNGNSIFLPAAGYRYNSNLNDAGFYGYYWSSSLYTGDNSNAYSLYFRSSELVELRYYYRYYGFSVRAVFEGDALINTYAVSVSSGEGGTAVASKSSVQEDGSVTLTATPNSGYLFKNWTLNGNVVSTQNPYTATITANSEYVANFEKNYTISVSAGIVPSNGGTVTINGETGTQYVSDGGTATFVATPNSGYVFKNWTLNGNIVSTQNPYTATVTANSEYVANFEVPINNGHKYVDLGLSVKWATCNVGATSPEEYGDYFAWGETTPKTTYDWSTYKYCNGTSDSMTKYCTSSNYGTVDNKTVLEFSDDAARVNWGGSWRMPTKAEYEELIDTNNCTWKWTTQNGVNGYKVTSKKNGNSIFFPAAGFRGSSYLNFAGSYGYCWSSSLITGDSYYAYYLNFDSSYVDWSIYDRCYGQSVRAVCE